MASTISRSETRPTTALPLVTTREPTFFACSQLAALLTVASGAIVATSAPFCLRMLSTDIASSYRMAFTALSCWSASLPGHAMKSVLPNQPGKAAYPIGTDQSAGSLRTTKAFIEDGRVNVRRSFRLEARPTTTHQQETGLRLRSERPLTFLVAQIAFIQAPGYLLAHRGIGCYRDNDAVLCDDLAASCLDREVFWSEWQASIGPVRVLPALGHPSKKLNST